MNENQLSSRVELRQFETIKNILDKEKEFTNNKINTYNTMITKTNKVIEHQKHKFTKDENFLLSN
jgi:hypothetical protein